MTYALGIDVGTCFTAAATWRDGHAQTVPLGDRANMVPSVLFLRGDGVMLAGDAADRSAVSEPARAARQFKRRVGDGLPVLLGGEPFSPQALLAAMVDWVVRRVAEREDAPAARVTLTCPANWREHRRRLVLEAVGATGLAGVDLITAPAAAAIWYASKQPVGPGDAVAVYDLGGGAFDAAVLRRAGGGFEPCGEPAGDDSLGGTELDRAVIDHVAASLGVRWSSLDLRNPAVLRALAQVEANAVQAKEALSSDLEASITVILPDVTGEVRLTRAQFEEMVRAPILGTVEKLGRVIAGAGAAARPRVVLLVGGSSRIPLVSALIASELGLPASVDVHPKFAVCLGAATAAGSRTQPAPASTPPAAPAPPASTPPAAPLAAPLAAAPAVAASLPDVDPPLLPDEPEAVRTSQELMLALPSQVEPESRQPAPAREGAASPGPPPARREPLPVVQAVPVAGLKAPGPGPPTLSPGGPPPLSPGGPPGVAPGRAGGGGRSLRWILIAAVAALLIGGLVWWLGSLGSNQVARRAVPATTTTSSPAPGQAGAPVWARLPEAPTAFESAGAAVFGDKVWLAGGFDEHRQASADLLIFDPSGRTWRRTPIKLPQAVSHSALVSTGRTLLLLGGYQGSGPDAPLTPLATTWQLDLATSTWVAGRPLPVPLGAGAAAWDGRRVVFAGGVGPGKRTSAAVLALENGTWRRLGSLPHARERLAAATDGKGRVWFLAGDTSDANRRAPSGEVDLVDGDSVRQVGQVPTARGSVAGFWAQSVGACAVGGRDRAGAPSARVECVDPAGRVVSLPALPTARQGLSAVMVGGAVYALGGTTSDRTASGVAESLRLPS